MRRVLELMRFDEAPGTVMLENHPIATHHIRAIDILRGIEPVADQFKDDVITGQCEDEHNHASRAFRRHEMVARILQMADEIAVEFRLGMTVETDRVVEIGNPFARHQLPQPLHQLVGRRCRHPEIGARVGKQNRQIAFADQDRIQREPGLIWVTQAQRDWCRCLTGHDATHQVRASFAIKNAPENLERRGFAVPNRRSDTVGGSGTRCFETKPAVPRKPGIPRVGQRVLEQIRQDRSRVAPA